MEKEISQLENLVNKRFLELFFCYIRIISLKNIKVYDGLTIHEFFFNHLRKNSITQTYKDLNLYMFYMQTADIYKKNPDKKKLISINIQNSIDLVKDIYSYELKKENLL